MSHAPKPPADFNAEFQSLLESLKSMGCRDDDLTELEKQQKRLETEYLQFDLNRRGVKMSEFSFDKQQLKFQEQNPLVQYKLSL